PPTTAPPPTLPVTGVAYERMRGIGIAGFAFVLGGIALLSAAALSGRLRVQQTSSLALGQHDAWLTIDIRPRSHTIYIALRATGSDPGSQIN
ncbi:MAG: hypothetical protein M3112_04790, partial [Actinomycetia bacterium]|nr:hypothetical protein [Actinomycetes bacterium]